jgi:hypothetical protein
VSLIGRLHWRIERFEARRAVLAALPRGGAGAEIGVWKGDYSARLLAAAQPSVLHLVDPWRFPDDGRVAGSSWGGRVAHSQRDLDAVHESVLRRFAGEIAAGRVVVHRAESAVAGETFADASLDWAYVDANHLYEEVSRDLALCRRKVKPGGLVCGDDYSIAGWWEDGVRRAVDEAVASGAYEPVALGGQYVLRIP